MFVGVVVENFHKCRETQEREEKARRAVKHSKKLDRKRRSECVKSCSMKLEGTQWRFYAGGRLGAMPPEFGRAFNLPLNVSYKYARKLKF